MKAQIYRISGHESSSSASSTDNNLLDKKTKSNNLSVGTQFVNEKRKITKEDIANLKRIF